MREFKDFEDIVLSKIDNIRQGHKNSIEFQVYGFSQESVKKHWKKLRKKYLLPRAKRIEQAGIYF